MGHWWPLLDPVTMLPALDPTPWVGGVRPFLLKNSSQFRTAGPNALNSAAWAKDYNEVKAIGALNSATRLPDQTHNALFWQSNGGPALLWNDVADDLVESPSHSLDMADSARLLAMMNLAAADAAINVWNDKYYYDFWRPWNAIPGATTAIEHRHRSGLDSAAHRAVPGAPVRAPWSRYSGLARADDVLRRQRPLRRDE